MANRYIVRLRATDAEDPEQRKTIDSEVVDSQADVSAVMKRLQQTYGHLLDNSIVEVEEVY